MQSLIKVAHEWLVIFDQSHLCAKALDQAECKTLGAYFDYIKNIASVDEIRIHIECSIEVGKVWASRTPCLCWHPIDCRDSFYVSKYLDDKVLELVSSAGYSSAAQWREAGAQLWDLEPDPVVRKLMQEDRKYLAQVKIGFLPDSPIATVLRNAFSHESRSSTFATTDSLSVDAVRRANVFTSSAMEVLGEVGFKPIASKDRHRAILERPAANGQVFRFSVGEETDYFSSMDTTCILKPTLCLRPATFKKRQNDAGANIRLLEFPYHLLVPGFHKAYTFCLTDAEIARATRAHALIVKWAMDPLCAALPGLFD